MTHNRPLYVAALLAFAACGSDASNATAQLEENTAEERTALPSYGRFAEVPIPEFPGCKSNVLFSETGRPEKDCTFTRQRCSCDPTQTGIFHCGCVDTEQGPFEFSEWEVRAMSGPDTWDKNSNSDPASLVLHLSGTRDVRPLKGDRRLSVRNGYVYFTRDRVRVNLGPADRLYICKQQFAQVCKMQMNKNWLDSTEPSGIWFDIYDEHGMKTDYVSLHIAE